MSERADVAVVGAGIVGLATARQLLLERPGRRVVVLEKEAAPALHQSGRNSGVVHSGVYYAPGSLKARLCVEGKRLLERYCDERGIPLLRRGKLVVALTAAELPRLAELERRARANGVPDLRLLSGDELRTVEPHVAGLRGLHVPGTGVVDFGEVARSFAADVAAAGGRVDLGREVTEARERGGAVELDTPGGAVVAAQALVCAGVQSDRIGGPADTRIVPFRGDYYALRGAGAGLVRGLVYPVPDPALPFLGVHLTRGIDGTVLAGPNAVPALARERYGRADVSLRDALDVLSYPGFWRFAARHARSGVLEAWRDVSRAAFLREVRRYLPELDDADAAPAPAGIRAQAITRDGRLADDFVIEARGRLVRVLSAPSPAATSSLAVARHLAAVLERHEGPADG